MSDLPIMGNHKACSAVWSKHQINKLFNIFCLLVLLYFAVAV